MQSKIMENMIFVYQIKQLIIILKKSMKMAENNNYINFDTYINSNHPKSENIRNKLF